MKGTLSEIKVFKGYAEKWINGGSDHSLGG
jgi:hypothetical protein